MRLQPWARAAFWVATVTVLVLTLSPGPLLPRDPFNLWDKAQHALAFALLTGLGLVVVASEGLPCRAGHAGFWCLDRAGPGSDGLAFCRVGRLAGGCGGGVDSVARVARAAAITLILPATHSYKPCKGVIRTVKIVKTVIGTARVRHRSSDARDHLISSIWVPCGPWRIGHDQAEAAGLAGALFGGKTHYMTGVRDFSSVNVDEG